MLSKKCSGRQVSALSYKAIATGRPHVIHDVSFDQCSFDSILLADSTGILGRRHEFADVRFTDCRFSNCLIKNADLTRVRLLRAAAVDGEIVLWKCFLRE